MAVGGTSSLDLNDLETELKEFKKSDWRKFGSEAGLSYNTLDEIVADNKGNTHQCFVECLSCWLKRKDNVDKRGKPSWSRLAEILDELDRTLADKIRSRKDVPIDVHKQQQVETVNTSGHNICLPEYLEDEYLRMTTEFANILKRFVIQIFKERENLKGVKMSLVGIRPSRRKEIVEIDDETELIQVLRNYCSLRKFPILTSLARDMKMTDITEELNQFEKKRKEFYSDILAKDFAKSAIEYCGTTGSREVTFEVTWSIDKATLDDLEQFLAAAFRSHDINMLIHLKTVRNSRLKFVCVIPHWLVDEMKDYVMKNGDLFKSKEVVEITVDGTIVFSVKHLLEPHQLENEEKEKESLQSDDEAKEKNTDQYYTQEERRSGEGYACMMFYENNSFIYFTAVPVKFLTALLEHIKDHHRFAEIGPIHYFHFKWSNSFIELNFNEKPSTGWTVIPLIKPCRLYQEDIDAFDGSDDSIPPHCFISFQGSPHAVPTLHYSVPLNGVAHSVTLYIHKTLESTASPAASYTGLVYHEKKEDQHLIIFNAARINDITSAVNCIEDQYPLARINKLIRFDFDSNRDHIELILDAPQDQSFTGWTVEPQSTKLYKDQVDRFSFTKALPPSCLVSFHESPDAVPTLRYSVPVKGVAEPKTLVIDLLLKSPGISSQDDMSLSYIGLIYYECKGKECLMRFTASRKINRLLKYIEEYHPLAEISQVYNFSFSPSCGFIELLFDDFCKGWTVQPLVEPCRLHQDDIDKFDEAIYPLPPSCLVSVDASPNADPTLHYSVPLEGVADPVTLLIDQKLQLEKDVLELIASHKTTFEKEKDRELAELTKKLYESLQKQSAITKEKQELSERFLALIKEQELPKQLGPDDKEEQELKFELQEKKAIFDTYFSKQQNQEVVEEMLRTDIYLKDKAIADLAKEKSQLLVEKSQLLEEIRKLKDKLNENDFKTQLKKTNSKIYSNEEKIFTEGQDTMAMAHSADYGGELHMPSDSERGYEALPKGIDRYELAIPQQEMTKTPLTIMVLGMTGAGKSTLINSMLGRKAAIAPDDLFPGTHDTIKEHTGSVYGTPVVFYDTRGLGDPFLNDKELMKKFKQKIVQCAGDRFTILICLRFVDRLDESVKYFRDFLAKLFKNDDAIWKSCILVLTQVNKFDTYDYESDEEDEGEENRSYISPEEVLKLKMNIRIKKSAMQFQSNLERYNVPEEIIMNMPVCVAGNKRHIKLPVTDNWIKTLMDCCHMRALNFQSAHRMKGQSQDMGMYYLSRAIGGTGGDVAPIVGIPIGVTIGSLVAYKMINSLYWRRIRDGEEKEFYDSKKLMN